jgi:integrase
VIAATPGPGPIPRRGDRSIPRTRLDKLFTDDRHGLRERVLWRMLYETAARAEELLSLNIEDLDLGFRRGRVHSKGGAIEYVHWATGTARLLPRLLRGRTSGPVFLADRRAPASGPRAPAAADICPETGRGRLSYPRAEYLFKPATAALDPHKKDWTLHQLRHSALQHLAVDGRTAPELQAKSRHQHLASLGRYVQLGEQALRPGHRQRRPRRPPQTPLTRIGTVDGGNSARVGPLTPLAVRLLLKPRARDRPAPHGEGQAEAELAKAQFVIDVQGKLQALWETLSESALTDDTMPPCSPGSSR